MHIFFSGIGGAGIGPLAEIAHDAGYDVSGSDLRESLASLELEKRDVDVIYEQTGESIAAEHLANPIDWLVYTSALPDDRPELVFARENGIRVSKRDEFLAEFIREKNLRLVAIAGTHGKTTTTGMFVWAAKELGLPVSYSVGSTLSFGPSGFYDPNAEYFVYECDEYDRNFLQFSPTISAIPSLDYDHADTYPTLDDYKNAFRAFIDQSDETILFEDSYQFLQPLQNENVEVFDHSPDMNEIGLPGQFMRNNAFLVAETLRKIDDYDSDELYQILAEFPGTDRRFEKLADNLYTDYAHHPSEIAATLQKAREISDNVVVVYQPHQNVRQHEVANEYEHAFDLANKVYWTPTYLVRENPDLTVLAPEDLIAKLNNPDVAESAELDENLWQKVSQHLADNDLVIFMGAGPIDAWLRNQISTDA